MSHQQNIAIAQKLLEGIGSSRDPAEIAAPFDANVRFEIQGDDGVLPWIGRKTGRQTVADFIRDIRALTETVTFGAEDIQESRWHGRALRLGRRAGRTVRLDRAWPTGPHNLLCQPASPPVPGAMR